MLKWGLAASWTRQAGGGHGQGCPPANRFPVFAVSAMSLPAACATGGPHADRPTPSLREQCPCRGNSRWCFRNFWNRLGGGTVALPRPASALTPCTHSVRDLNGLTCFRYFWNDGIWRHLFLVALEYQVCSVAGGWGWHFRDTDYCPATSPYPFLSFWGFRLGNHLMTSAFRAQRVAACVSLRRARTTSLSEQHKVLFPSHFRTLVLLSQRGWGGGTPIPTPSLSYRNVL